MDAVLLPDDASKVLLLAQSNLSHLLFRISEKPWLGERWLALNLSLGRLGSRVK
jgi:hypothetical protein